MKTIITLTAMAAIGLLFAAPYELTAHPACGGLIRDVDLKKARQEPKGLIAWQVEIQHSDDAAMFVDAPVVGYLDAPVNQRPILMPIPDTSANRSDPYCPDGNCPAYANSIPIEELRRQLAAEAAGGPIAVGISRGSCGCANANCPAGCVASCPAATSLMATAPMMAAATIVVTPSTTTTHHAMGSEVHGQVNKGGQFRPYGSRRDGQGWWLFKRFGRAMPARKARARGY